MNLQATLPAFWGDRLQIGVESHVVRRLPKTKNVKAEIIRTFTYLLMDDWLIVYLMASVRASSISSFVAARHRCSPLLVEQPSHSPSGEKAA